MFPINPKFQQQSARVSRVRDGTHVHTSVSVHIDFLFKLQQLQANVETYTLHPVQQKLTKVKTPCSAHAVFKCAE